jgi:hypothetical protein
MFVQDWDVSFQKPLIASARLRKKVHISDSYSKRDTRIVVDVISLAQSDAYDIGIVVSGDSDLAEAIDWVREHTRKRMENACYLVNHGLNKYEMPLT